MHRNEGGDLSGSDPDPLVIWHWIAVHLGLTNGSGAYYLWWSGIVGDLTIFTALAVWWKKHTCHTRRCPRWARYPLDGTPYTVCHKCHPQVPDRKPSRGDIHEHWRRGRA